MAQMGEIQHRGDPTDVKGVMNYVYQLEEQIRYVLQNLGSDNLAPGSVDVAQLGPNVTKQFTTIIQGQDDLETYTRKKVSSIQDEFGNYSTRVQTENYIAQYVADELGDYSLLSQTADNFTAAVIDGTYGKISGIKITKPGIEITGSQYIKLGTDGKLIISAGNFTINEHGDVKFETGLIGGFAISEGYMGEPNTNVYMQKDMLGQGQVFYGGMFVNGYRTISIGGGTVHPIVLYACTDGRVFLGDADDPNSEVNIHGYKISDGWIKDASHSGNTLTLTRHNGLPETFTPTFTAPSPFSETPNADCDGVPGYIYYVKETNTLWIYFENGSNVYHVALQG